MGRVRLSVKLIILKFATPFKIGNGENYIDAITIYRAFIKALSYLGEPFDDIMNGSIKFSSTFPYKGELFIKMPFRQVVCQDRRKEKEIRSIQYVSLKTYEEIEPPYLMECEGDKIIIQGVNYEYKYATGRVYTESEFKAERFDVTPIIGGDIQINLVSQLFLLPLGSLVKNSKRMIVGDTNSIKNTVIIDPILL
jgi:CRISPR/Cas system CSM-associated protein Csm4 (group 5 of RAMP superfamily)